MKTRFLAYGRTLKCVALFCLFFFPAITGWTEEQNHLQRDHATEQLKTQNDGNQDRVPVSVPLLQQNKIGLKTFTVEKRQLIQKIRTVGIVKTDQTLEAHIHTRINGWIEKITADSIGKALKKGDRLFELYSPDLVTTQEEYVMAMRQGRVAKEVADTALNRLRLWNVPTSFIERLVTTQKIQRTVSFDAPINGIITDKQAILGMYVTPDMQLYSLADLSRVWIMITLYEADLSRVNVGDAVNMKLPYDPTKKFAGTINYIYPEIDLNSRTVQARVEINNNDGFLRPGMFADIDIVKDLGETLVLPVDAIIDTGMRSLVFIQTDSLVFEPKEIEIGPRVGGFVPVLGGLNSGDHVIINANFLIDAESKLQAVLQRSVSPIMSGHEGHNAK